MVNNKIYNTQDLVLQVSKSYDPAKLNLKEYKRFLNALCGNREYQKEAIEAAIIYLAYGKYKSIEDLVQENAKQNPNLTSRYHTLEDYKRKLQLPQKLSATIDLATGTGKSYVMYGIAQIALSLGIVDKVLVLCPSLTIKDELTKKFIESAADKRLIEALPTTAHWRNPHIINANETIQSGFVCVTNIHAVYSSNNSSIVDSLGFNKGNTCLVLSDEVHHAYNKIEGRDEESQSIKKWREFLLDTSFSFRFMLGFTGTAYVENDYFNDVIYRYSLRQAIEEGFVKKIDYVHKDESSTENERFQKIYQNHRNNKDAYPSVKPLTILITKDIKEARRLHTRLTEFLVERGEGSEEQVSKEKILLVTSHNDHKSNVLRLPYVDNQDNAVEWIISVAMLTEGWDVKNVFQIVPMEEKAFNSKLLIAQVLGRGLRVPPAYPVAKVTVFNHDSWSGKIQDLVNEILEIEQRLKNSVVKTGERAKYHFELYNINYDKKEVNVDNPNASKEPKEFKYKDFVNLPIVSETFVHETETVYVTIDGKETAINYKVDKEKFHISDILAKIIHDFETRDWEGRILKLSENQYTQNNLPPREELEKLIRTSMERVGITGDYVGKANRQAIYSMFNTLLRQSNVSRQYEKFADDIINIKTENREHESISVLSLRQNATVFYTEDYQTEIAVEDTLIYFNEVLEDKTLPRQAISDKLNHYVFKTPVDLVFVSHDPERKFIEQLIKHDISPKIKAWVKSNNQNFYKIDYTLQIGTHSTQHQFNPDFFLLIDTPEIEYIIVAEIKADGDDSDENKAKMKYAKDHFKALNEQLQKSEIKQKYIFHFISPTEYPTFFQYLKDGTLIEEKYYGTLEKLLNNDTP